MLGAAARREECTVEGERGRENTGESSEGKAEGKDERDEPHVRYGVMLCLWVMFDE